MGFCGRSTHEVVQEIAREMIQTSNITPEYWIQSIGIIISVLVIAFSIYKFGRSQQIHNKTQQESQRQFNEIHEQTKNLEFVKRLEYYDAEFAKTTKEFLGSNQTYYDCIVFSKRFMVILDRLSYLKIKELVNDDFTHYFENEFNSGKTFLNWLEFTVGGSEEWKNTYIHFRKVVDSIISKNQSVLIYSSFYYYAHEFDSDLEYDPKIDTFDSKKYIPTVDDHKLLRSN